MSVQSKLSFSLGMISTLILMFVCGRVSLFTLKSFSKYTIAFSIDSFESSVFDVELFSILMSFCWIERLLLLLVVFEGVFFLHAMQWGIEKQLNSSSPESFPFSLELKNLEMRPNRRLNDPSSKTTMPLTANFAYEENGKNPFVKIQKWNWNHFSIRQLFSKHLTKRTDHYPKWSILNTLILHFRAFMNLLEQLLSLWKVNQSMRTIQSVKSDVCLLGQIRCFKRFFHLCNVSYAIGKWDERIFEDFLESQVYNFWWLPSSNFSTELLTETWEDWYLSLISKLNLRNQQPKSYESENKQINFIKENKLLVYVIVIANFSVFCCLPLCEISHNHQRHKYSGWCDDTEKKQ